MTIHETRKGNIEPNSGFTGTAHLSALTCCAMAIVIFSAQPVGSQNMIFNTSPEVSNETCIVELLQDGLFGTRPDQTVLNSQNFGGTGAQIRVTSRKRLPGDAAAARFRITLTPPTSFDIAPTGGDDNVDFRTRFSGQSVNNGVNFGIRNGTNSRGLPRFGTSVTLVTGHLRARKTTGVFPTGNYRAEAVFLCE